MAFIASGARMSYGVFVIPLSDAFALSRSEAVLPLSLSMVVWGLVQPFTGALMDSRGPRIAILGSVVAMALGFAASASAQNLWQLTLGYGLLVGGASSGLAVAAFSLLMGRWFGPQQRGRAIGLVLAGIPMGSVVFAPLTSALANEWSWRGAFLFLAAVLSLVALPLTWFLLREPAGGSRPALSSRGGFIFNPEVLRAVKTRAYWLLLVAYFGCGSSGLFLYGHLPAIALEHGFSALVGATALGLVGVGGAAGAVIGGWASDRFGRYQTLALGYLVRGVGFILLIVFASDVPSFYASALVAGLPVFVTITVTQLLIYEIFGTGIAGRMLGLTFLLHQVGSTLGPYLGGRLFEATQSYTTALLLGAGVLMLSSFVGWRLKAAVKAQPPPVSVP